jgi:PleD family two-component response regulator
MTKARILIVEDDSDLAEMLETFFSTQDYDVTTAAWGAEGLEAARQHPHDVIMLDIRLPDINGYEVCRQLRAQRRTQKVPILFLTEKRDRVDKLQGLELGVVDYITKPFDITEVKLRVRNALNRARQSTPTHSVTELPEGALVNERLTAVLRGDQPRALLAFALRGLPAFRARFGFVAADDVLRALTLMMRNAVRELGSEDDFIGHLDDDTFLLITQPGSAEGIRERVETKMYYSREFFYPLQVRAATGSRLDVEAEAIISLQSAIIDLAAAATADVLALRRQIVALLGGGLRQEPGRSA